MSVKYILESGIMERKNIHSGRIFKEGSSPVYGVIFSSNELKTEDDLGLDPELMVGAYIGEKDVPNEDRDSFFEILGGYFFHDNYPDPGITTKVFGIALQPEFGLVEGGTITLKDKWKLDDPYRPILDESHWSEQFGKHHGWTFIVTLKEREKYPHSGDIMKIIAYCPEFEDVSVEIGECEYDSEGIHLKRKVTYRISATKTDSKKWIFHFGDGSTESGDGTPPESIDHLYGNKPESPPKICLEGHTACEEICKEIDLSHFDNFKICPRCPEIKNISVTFGECITEGDVRRRKVTFAVSIEGDQPNSWTWHFGDGAKESGDGMPPTTIDHYYEKKPDAAPKLCIIGPKQCRETCKEADMEGFVVCPPCPKIERIDHEITDREIDTKLVHFTVVVSHGKPEKFEWDWGDDSPKEITSDPEASHVYQMLATDLVQYTVTVNSTGPEDCQDSAQTALTIHPVQCPEIEEIGVSFGECATKGNIRNRKVTFQFTISGLEPDSWIFHFGDGSTKSGNGAPPSKIEYFYHKKPGNAPKLCLKGPEPCKETCQEADMSGFEECLPCPHITALKCKSMRRDKNTETFEYRAELSRSPDKFQWDFGDGSPLEETTEPVTQHAYKILERDSIYSVKMTSVGPEDCKHSMKDSITVRKGFIESKFCFWLHLLVTFLMASTFGALITYGAAKIFEPAENYSWLMSIIIILALLTGISIILWYRFVSRKLCPKPGKCDWLNIGWIVLLAGMLVALYVSTICAGWWWIVIIILMIATAILLFRWYKTCLIRPGRIFLSFVACVLSVLFVCYFIAYPIIEMVR